MKLWYFILKLTLLIFFSNHSLANISVKNKYTKNDIQNLIIENAKQTKYVSPALGLAVAKIESNFNYKAISSKGAVGVMQIMPLTAKKIYGIERHKLFNPIINIKIGLHFLDSLIKRYKGRIDIALSHYNGGSSVGKWPNLKIIPATHSYVIKVLKTSSKFKNRKNYIMVKLDQKKFYDPYAELKNNFESIDTWLDIVDDYKKRYN
tara:strand:- start:30 stop:647 length:618 start_codon:yes stop_codon:yes gene_type:complete